DRPAISGELSNAKGRATLFIAADVGEKVAVAREARRILVVGRVGETESFPGAEIELNQRRRFREIGPLGLIVRIFLDRRNQRVAVDGRVLREEERTPVGGEHAG